MRRQLGERPGRLARLDDHLAAVLEPKAARVEDRGDAIGAVDERNELTDMGRALAAVLWSGGISFAGVLSFLFADLIVLPILLIYRKYYGTAFALRITGLMFVTMVMAALIVDAAKHVGADLIVTGLDLIRAQPLVLQLVDVVLNVARHVARFIQIGRAHV